MSWFCLYISWSYYYHFISMVLILVYAYKYLTFLKECSCRIMPVAAKWVNFDFLFSLLFHKWIVLECNSKCFTLQVLPSSKCFRNSVIFESCLWSSALYLFILMIIFFMWAQFFPTVSVLWLLMIYLFTMPITITIPAYGIDSCLYPNYSCCGNHKTFYKSSCILVSAFTSRE